MSIINTPETHPSQQYTRRPQPTYWVYKIKAKFVYLFMAQTNAYKHSHFDENRFQLSGAFQAQIRGLLGARSIKVMDDTVS